MFEAIQSFLPMEWRRTVEFLGAPLWWIPEWQAAIMQFNLGGDAAWEVVLRRVFLLLPSLILVVGVWVSVLTIYTVPFRAERGRFVTTMSMAWWDAGRSIWFFWSGVVRLFVVVIGWVWSLIRLFFRLLSEMLKGIVQQPFAMLDWTSRRYFKPGVPWIAFLLTIAWSALEATIFTYTLLPTTIEVLSNITGFDPNRAVVAPILYMFLFMLIAGSFACIEVLTQAVKARKAGQIVQMVFVEFFVMFFEVMFLYRELVDAVSPWIAQQTGGEVQLGLVGTLGLAAIGWIGIRGMTWFLFGRYGTPAILAVLSRETLGQADHSQPSLAGMPTHPKVYAEAVAALKTESAWFKQEARSVFELLTLPVLQLLAAAINFPVVAVRSQPVFVLPFNTLDEVLAATPFTGSESQARSAAAARAGRGAA